MTNEQNLILSKETTDFLHNAVLSQASHREMAGDKDKTIHSALIYEKFRVAVEYQEEHLVFKNAIARILRRQYALYGSKSSTDSLLVDLINELTWANYLNPESLDDSDMLGLKKIMSRYLVLLQYARSGRMNKHELQKVVIDLLACEIDEALIGGRKIDSLIDYAYKILRPNLEIGEARITEEESEIQLKSAIYNLVAKPDLALMRYWLLEAIYKDWHKLDEDELKKFARSFDPFFNKIDRALNHPLRQRYLLYTKKNIAPFILLYHLLNKKSSSQIESFIENPVSLHRELMSDYSLLTMEARKKVWRGTWRALLFVFLTKISLAFILEMPFDRLVTGSVHYSSLTVNILLPPILMLISGTFVKSPPAKNEKIVSSALFSIFTYSKIDDKKFQLTKPKPDVWDRTFSLFYSLLSIAILSGVIWLLYYLHFNIISISLFFLFVSAVSFFSFRIRNIALALAMKRSKDSALVSAMELIFLPFIHLGKALSEGFARYNIFILALDFVIEAPLKTIIRITNSWLKFVNKKKDEIELD